MTEVDVDTLITKLDRSRFNQMSARTSRAMLSRMGRNLLLFNQIEGCLKRTLPYIHPEGSAKGGDGLTQFRRRLRKQPLGPIGKCLVESMSSPDIGAFKKYVASVVKSRNALMHHFLDQPDISMSEAGGRTAIQWLDEQHAHCEPMQTFCRNLMVLCLHEMERVAEDRGEELAVPEWRVGS